jgi:hypothetical protein
LGRYFGVQCISYSYIIDLNRRSQNRFAEKLGPLGLDPFRMLVVDLMHECELGTWKALFTHLMRLLYSLPQGIQLVATFDSRYIFCVDSSGVLTNSKSY